MPLLSLLPLPLPLPHLPCPTSAALATAVSAGAAVSARPPAPRHAAPVLVARPAAHAGSADAAPSVARAAAALPLSAQYRQLYRPARVIAPRWAQRVWAWM